MRPKTIERSDIKEVVINLIDLGFSAAAVGFMLNMTPTNVYAHLRSMDRMNGRNIVRGFPSKIHSRAYDRIGRIFPDQPWVGTHLLAAARQSAIALTASVTKPISDGSESKGASSAKGRRKRTT